MLGEEEYASSTDESDEDYNPNGNESDAPSEVESDGEAEDVDTETIQKGRKRKGPTVNEPSKVPRSECRKSPEKQNADKPLEDDDDDNEDAIWASFLSKSAETAPQLAKITGITAKTNELKNKIETTAKPKTETVTKQPEKKQIVTEIFEFAGEKVEVKKEVKIDSKPKETSTSSNEKSTESASVNRPRVGGAVGRSSGGLSSVLGQLGKKNKLSVLEKTKLDWTGFKDKEGIDEELQTHNKGRDGFLERQDFLERTDLRRFEIEKSIRQTTRRK